MEGEQIRVEWRRTHCMNKLLLLLIAILFGFFNVNAQGLSSKTSENLPITIDTVFTPEIGGIKQAIEIKTDNSEKPVLLFLSGGPGSSMINTAAGFTDKLKDKFTIVQWDQRDAGKTLKLNPSPNKPTIVQMQNDTFEVVQFVTKKLNKKKIYLAGSSFGNVLGFYIAQKHPKLLHAYLAMNPVINSLESEKLSLEKLKDVHKDNKTAVEELSVVKIPFEKAEDLFYIRKWLFVTDGNKGATSDGFKKGFLQWSETWFPAIQEIMQMNLQKSLKKVKCPIYFFVGKDDIQTSTKITEEYFNKLKAPKKELYLFEKSAHSVHKTEPEKFQNIVIEEILFENTDK
jgi:pimeloyl-ACP methyl ester carboxylesterase